MKNIVLVGFMASGKTTVGGRLAKDLHLEFVDTDDIIEEEAGKSIKEIFSDEGEEAFRCLEKKVVKEVTEKEDQVIACGGGVVLYPQNVEALKKTGVVLYLKVSPNDVRKRVGKDTARPLLNVANKKKQVESLLCRREKAYLEAADFIIDTSSLEADEVVEAVKKQFGKVS